MPASRKMRTFSQSDSDLDALLAGMDRAQNLEIRMIEGLGATAKSQPSPLVKTRSQSRAAIRGTGKKY